MNTTKRNNLSFYNEQGVLTLNAKQFDTGRKFIFHIMDHDEPFDLSDCTVYLRIAKADGTQFQGRECCSINGSNIIIDTSVGNGSQILTAAGTNICELHLEDSNGISLTTWNFNILTEPRVHDGSHISSIDSYDVLDNMVNLEKERIANENQRKENEENRKTEFQKIKDSSNSIITECNSVIDTANQKISSFDAEINEIVSNITDEEKSYAENAKNAETNAADSASTAIQKANELSSAASLAKSYAVGDSGFRQGENTDNAKYYNEKAHEALEALQKTAVTGIKGSEESDFRHGNVNITAKNIGALPVDGGTIGNDDERFSYNGFGFNGTGNQSINNFYSIDSSNITATEIVTQCCEITTGNQSISIDIDGIHGNDSQSIDGFSNISTDNISASHLYYNSEDTDERYVKKSTVLNTLGEISANADAGHIASAMAINELKSEFADRINQINSNFMIQRFGLVRNPEHCEYDFSNCYRIGNIAVLSCYLDVKNIAASYERVIIVTLPFKIKNPFPLETVLSNGERAIIYLDNVGNTGVLLIHANGIAIEKSDFLGQIIAVVE